MIENLTNKWIDATQKLQARFRWLGYALTIAAFAYIVALIFWGDFPIETIPWEAYWWVSLLSVGIYLISLLLQFFVWARMLSFHRRINWQDLAIFFRVLLMRRLPGGIWHWVGRATIYKSTTQLSSKVVLIANFLEWTLHILISGGIIILGLVVLQPLVRWLGFSVLLSLAVFLAQAWQPSHRKPVSRVAESILWCFVFGLSWGMGGLIILLLARASGIDSINIWQSTWIWGIAGGTSLLMILIPAGLGIREITLTWLLQPYMTQEVALLIAILIRVIFTIADLLWGSLGWWISHRIAEQKTAPAEHQ
jgi:hypothetical protein